MKNDRLTVVALFKALQGAEAGARVELTKLVAPTRAEDGCINYDLYQSVEDPRDFIFYENWSGMPTLAAHRKTPHILELSEKIDRFFTKPPEVLLLRESDG